MRLIKDFTYGASCLTPSKVYRLFERPLLVVRQVEHKRLQSLQSGPLTGKQGTAAPGR